MSEQQSTDREASARQVRHVAVLGLMGVGKTTVGRIIAASLGWPLRDSDDDIERSTGHTVRELRDSIGVDRMHELEARHLIEALDEPDPSVVAAAASTIDVAASRDRLEHPDVVAVWLRAPAAALAARFGSADDHRPAYGDDPAAFLARQAAQRDPLFASVADVVVEAAQGTPQETADRAIAALGPLLRPGDPAPIEPPA